MRYIFNDVRDVFAFGIAWVYFPDMIRTHFVPIPIIESLLQVFFQYLKRSFVLGYEDYVEGVAYISQAIIRALIRFFPYGF
jgi:hypothetical protein